MRLVSEAEGLNGAAAAMGEEKPGRMAKASGLARMSEGPPLPGIQRKARRSPPPRRSMTAPGAMVVAVAARLMDLSGRPPAVMSTPRGSIHVSPSGLVP